MADDSLQTGTDVISTDHVSTLNGAAITPGVSTPKVQRVKVCYGDDNTSRDVSLLFPLPVVLQTATLLVTAVSTAGAAVTATLPAAGAGLFHYISMIEISLYATAARTGAATPVIVTTTNLPGPLAKNFPTAQVIGSIYREDVSLNIPLRSNVANTATTIVCPIATSGIWRVNVAYYTAA